MRVGVCRVVTNRPANGPARPVPGHWPRPPWSLATPLVTGHAHSGHWSRPPWSLAMPPGHWPRPQSLATPTLSLATPALLQSEDFPPGHPVAASRRRLSREAHPPSPRKGETEAQESAR